MNHQEEPHPSPEKKRRNSLKILAVIGILLFPSLLYLALSSGKHNMTALPYYGEREAIIRTIDGKSVTDTLYHTIPDFSLENQSGRTITSADLRGKIYVADFIFTTCPTICPKMSTQMVYVQQKLSDHDDVWFVSHTVDPEHDTAEVLAEYASTLHADTSNWHFLTGPKAEIYELGVKGYLLPVAEDVLAPGGFLHSEQFVLVDREGHIRGMYDGTVLKEVNEMIDAIRALKAGEIIKEQNRKAKEKKKNQ